jgi:hypothetical protein
MALVDTISNDAKHNNNTGKQPNYHSDVLPHVSNEIVGASTVRVLRFVRQERDYADYANTNKCEHASLALSSVGTVTFAAAVNCCSVG